MLVLDATERRAVAFELLLLLVDEPEWRSALDVLRTRLGLTALTARVLSILLKQPPPGMLSGTNSQRGNPAYRALLLLCTTSAAHNIDPCVAETFKQRQLAVIQAVTGSVQDIDTDSQRLTGWLEHLPPSGASTSSVPSSTARSPSLVWAALHRGGRLTLARDAHEEVIMLTSRTRVMLSTDGVLRICTVDDKGDGSGAAISTSQSVADDVLLRAPRHTQQPSAPHQLCPLTHSTNDGESLHGLVTAWATSIRDECIAGDVSQKIVTMRHYAQTLMCQQPAEALVEGKSADPAHHSFWRSVCAALGTDNTEAALSQRWPSALAYQLYLELVRAASLEPSLSMSTTSDDVMVPTSEQERHALMPLLERCWIPLGMDARAHALTELDVFAQSLRVHIQLSGAAAAESSVQHAVHGALRNALWEQVAHASAVRAVTTVRLAATAISHFHTLTRHSATDNDAEGAALYIQRTQRQRALKGRFLSRSAPEFPDGSGIPRLATLVTHVACAVGEGLRAYRSLSCASDGGVPLCVRTWRLATKAAIVLASAPPTVSSLALQQLLLEDASISPGADGRALVAGAAAVEGSDRRAMGTAGLHGGVGSCGGTRGGRGSSQLADTLARSEAQLQAHTKAMLEEAVRDHVAALRAQWRHRFDPGARKAADADLTSQGAVMDDDVQMIVLRGGWLEKRACCLCSRPLARCCSPTFAPGA